MATKSKGVSKYSAKPEFLGACRNKGMQLGKLTGKAELAVVKTAVLAVTGTAAVAQGLLAGHKANR